MRFLADENFPVAAVAVRANGRDVVWVLTHAPSTDDLGGLAWATRENRILRTFDKDFGKPAVDPSLPATDVILFPNVARQT
jgi:predicted nuclease of predicted toxin-antitoxin system